MNCKETFFSLLDKAGISWHGQTESHAVMYHHWPLVPEASQMNLTDNEVDIFFWSFADSYGHTRGPFSAKVKQYIKNYDKRAGELYTQALKKHKKVNLFAFSDHGMCEVKNFVDLRPVFKSLEFKQPKDFVAFFDATMMRLWYHKKGIREKIVEAFKKVPELTYLDDELRERYHVRFKDRKWGDDIFLVETGTRIFPDFFAPIRSGIVGTHGYAPDKSLCSYGFFLSNAFRTKEKEMDVANILPSILKALGLESEIPEDIDGKSVW